ncbi:hypothetical protein BHG93_16740 [Salmonella enterica]|nr:hypothetical protein [Salmonella enterica]PVL54374.1 hypothetical protein C4803_13605 [Salmonella enterica subsp. arizonae serovar 51:g,z51:-]
MDCFLHQSSFSTEYWCYDRHRSVRLVICFDFTIDQIVQSGLSSLKVICYLDHLFSSGTVLKVTISKSPASNLTPFP